MAFLSSFPLNSLSSRFYSPTPSTKNQRDPYNVHAVWVTSERRPIKGGGLGVVSQTIPHGTNQTANMDMRVIIPGSKPILEQAEALLAARTPHRETSHDTGIAFSLTDMYGKQQEMRVQERYEQKTNTWVYSIHNDDWFGKYNSVYAVGGKAGEYKNRDEMIHAHLLFSQAAAELSKYLGHENSRNMAQKTRFPRGFHPFSRSEHHGKLDVVIANDTQTAAVLPLTQHMTHPMYVLHNQYDQPIPLKTKQGDPNPVIPSAIAALYRKAFPGRPVFSPLALGIQSARSNVVNHNYAKDLIEREAGPLDGNYAVSEDTKEGTKSKTADTDKTSQKQTLPTRNAREAREASDAWNLLRLKKNAGQAIDIHHEAPPNYNPYKVITASSAVNPFSGKPSTLRIEPLKTNPSIQDVKAWKQDALKQVHQYLGMPHNPQAVPFFFVGRLDPRQKGTFLILDNMKELVTKHPNLEFFFAIPDLGEPTSKKLIEKLQADPVTKDKVRFFVGVEKQTINKALAAASVGGLAPSGDEPMGLIQLEYGQMFAAPVVTRAQGLLSTTNDVDSVAYRKKHGYTAFAPDVQDFGQTAYHLDLDTQDLQRYQQSVLYRMMKPEERQAWNLTPEDLNKLKEAGKKANTAYRDTISRVYNQYQKNPDEVLQVGYNMAHYAKERHNQHYISNNLWRNRIIMPSLDRDRQQSQYGKNYPEEPTPWVKRAQSALAVLA